MKKILLLLLLTLLAYAASRSYTRHGDTTPGVNSSYTANFLYFMKVNVTTAGRLDSVAVYVQFGNASFKGALYDDNGTGGLPGTLLDTTVSATTVSTTEIWYSAPFASGIELEAGTYWIGMKSNITLWHARSAGAAGTSGFQANNFAVAFPSTATLTGLGNLSDNDVYIVTSVAADVDKQNKYVGFGGFKKY